MSIYVASIIRRTCLYSGGTLNVLLTLADFGDDEGRDIYPGLDYLAALCRQTERATQDCLKRLRIDGVLILVGPDGDDLSPDQSPKGGRGHRTQYRIDTERMKILQGFHQEEEPDCPFCIAKRKRVKSARGKGEVSGVKGEVCDTKGEVFVAHIEEPSKEPLEEPLEETLSARAASAPRNQSTLFGFEGKTGNGKHHPGPQHRRRPGNDRSDLEAAYASYNEVASRAGWTSCQRATTLRDGHLRKRLQEVGGLEGWNVALEKAGASNFLCGKVRPREGDQPFRLDIDFLLTQSKFTKLMEGGYDNRGSNTSTNGSGRIREAARSAAERLNLGSENRRDQAPDVAPVRN